MFKLIVNPASPYHVAASRSAAATFCKLRGSVVVPCHTNTGPVDVGAAYDGFSVPSAASTYPSAPYCPFQFPCVVVSSFTNATVAVLGGGALAATTVKEKVLEPALEVEFFATTRQ